jgi:hypothetical protein
MSRLRELSEYKNTIIQRLVGNMNILKAVYYQNENFLEQPDVSTDKVLYSNIFPYNFIPSTDEELRTMKTYITLSISDYKKAGGPQFKAGNIFINVFTHKNLFRTNYGVLRVDYIISEVDEIMNSKRGLGLGQLEFVGMKDSYFTSDYNYLGSTLHYRPVDFN